MKITCQACQSKYTIADDKIQGKVAKIRCRKCGATVLVDASAGGGSRNGSVAPAADEVWLVSVAEGDQRPMQLQEVVDAYNSGVIVGDTYMWKEGMGDWQPLSEIAEIVNALNEANAAATAQEDYQPAAAPAAYSPPVEYSPPAAYSPAPAVAARRETSRSRGDLFGGAAVVEEEIATSAPVHAARGGGGMLGMSASPSAQRSGLTGARDEQSVLFSLSALTSGAKSPSAAPPPVAPAPSTTSRSEDSGLIDLNALAKAQQASKATEDAAPLAAPTPFLFPAALGTVETFQPAAEPKKKSSTVMWIAIGIGVAGIAIGIALFAGGKKDEVAAPTAPTVSAMAEPAPAPAATTDTATAAADSAASVASAKAPAKKTGGGGARAVKAPAGGAAPGPATPLPAAPPKPKSPCGCAASDLQCQIRCSAVGK